MSNEKMVTIQAPVGALIITKEQIEPMFRRMFDDGMACESRHHTNDEQDEVFFQERLNKLLHRIKEPSASKVGIGENSINDDDHDYGFSDLE